MGGDGDEWMDGERTDRWRTADKRWIVEWMHRKEEGKEINKEGAIGRNKVRIR
jgi:hypothetical protein